MTGPTKILTVSYGTFSCTLEGFDDPLGSMREMAEYFRDLAADDRYFGAEPPQPDVEMLQRIAEQEIQRRVEAKVSGSGVKLVASDRVRSEPARAKAEKPAEKADDFSERSAVTSGPLTYEDDYTTSDEPEDAFWVDPKASAVAQGPAESVAEKLRRIREVVSRNIELDHDAARAEQAPNAGNPDLRQRALSETIRRIQDDIAEDDDLAEPEAAAPAAEEEAMASDDAPEVRSGDDGSDVAVEALSDDEGADAEAAEDDTRAEDDAAHDESRDDDDEDDTPEEVTSAIGEAASDEKKATSASRTFTEVLGQVVNRISADEDENDTGEDLPAPHVLSRTLSPEPDNDVARLLDETDTKLNEDESVRRRRVISQMRAAVAATKADRMATGGPKSREAEEEAQQDPYREDLTEAVEEPPSVRSETSRRISAPPLVLVSSQRIDSELRTDSASAAAFAKNFGASGLPELMEAAAAYRIFSEGQSSFTRPEIMEIVTRMDPALQSSREESLRLFGQLLREGTFKKLERGQFTIDQGTRYNPGKSAADG